jgi:hypothetical protein
LPEQKTLQAAIRGLPKSPLESHWVMDFLYYAQKTLSLQQKKEKQTSCKSSTKSTASFETNWPTKMT